MIGQDASQTMFAAVILGLICILAFISRLFAVVKYESVIHEFDPYFNFRGTQYAVENSLFEFWNWFDDTVWYPLGRHVGYTVYPGLMVTASAIYNSLHGLGFPIEIRNVCVFMAPIFAANTCLVTFFMTREAWDTGAGLVAAALISMAPGYMSRSVAGSYDNECIAIFALLLVFFTFMKSVKTGSLLWAGLCASSYFYMVMAWGGYIYITNLIPAYTYGLLILGRYSHRLYVAYCIWYTLGSLFCMQVPFVGMSAMWNSTHMASHAVFVLIQVTAVMRFTRQVLDKQQYQKFLLWIVISLVVLGGAGVAVSLSLGALGSQTTTRFYTLLDPQSDKIPIISSVSEHQPSSWPSYFFDLHFMMFLAPVGVHFCVKKWTDSALFLVAYGMTSAYFSAIMIRLVLVMAPATVMLSAIAVSASFSTFFKAREDSLLESKRKPAKFRDSDEDDGIDLDRTPSTSQSISTLLNSIMSLVTVMFVLLILLTFVVHSIWATHQAYSNPSIVMFAGGGPHPRLLDDFREAYRWLNQNTPEDSKIASWWDYGYQTSAMAGRTTLVDNNTWNNTHIATIGRVMASMEDNAVPILRKLDIDYLLVVFGGYVGYSSDDINKFAWMVKISGGVYPKAVKEENFGHFSAGQDATPTMLNCMMYKMCYYRFHAPDGRRGYDVMRGQIGRNKYPLSHIEEAYTTEHWMTRIFKVKKDANRSPINAVTYQI